MKIELTNGDELVVTLKDTDGEFRILYDVNGDNRLRVLADMSDDKNRGGHPEMAEQWGGSGPAPVLDPEIYCESFGVHDERDEEGALIPSDHGSADPELPVGK